MIRYRRSRSAHAAALATLAFACTTPSSPLPRDQGTPTAASTASAIPSAASATAPAASIPPPPILTIPNSSRAELGLLVRYPGYTTAIEVAGRVVIGGLGNTVKILDEDLLHGRDIDLGTPCNDPHVLGDRLLCAKGSPAVILHMPGGEVEPYPFHDIWEVVHVGPEVVLRRCPTVEKKTTMLITILSRDWLHGRDVPTEEVCGALHGLVGDALYYGGYTAKAPQWLMHLPSGVIEPYVHAPDEPPHMPTQPPPPPTVIGQTRYQRGHIEIGAYDGLDAFDVANGRVRWHALWGEPGLPVPSEGAIVVRSETSLVELDPATGNVLWEQGIAGITGDEAFHTATDITAVSGGGNGGALAIHQGDPSSKVVDLAFYKRGAPALPMWAGNIRGRIILGGDKKFASQVEGQTVTAGSAHTTTDKQGRYVLDVASSGWVTVRLAAAVSPGMTAEAKMFQVVPGHGPYEVNLHLSYFDQACR